MDILGTLKPLFLFSAIFGLLPYETIERNNSNVLRISRIKRAYSNVLFFLIVGLNAYFEVNNVNIFKKPTTVRLFQISILKLNYYHFYLTSFAIFRAVFSKTKALCSCLNNVNRLCQNNLFTLNSHDLSKFSCRLVIFSYSYYSTLVTSALVAYSYLDYDFGLRNASERFAAFVFFTFLWITNLFLKHFIIFTNVVRMFYKKLNRGLTERNNSKHDKQFVVVMLKRVRMADWVMKDFVQVLCEFYMTPILSRMSWSFLTFLHAIISSLNKIPTSVIIIWQTYIILEIISLLCISHFTSAEAEKTANHLHELFIENDDPEIKEEVEILSLQLQHRKVSFNVCGFFTLDFTLLYSMIGALTTYIIILMQFQKDDSTFYEWHPKHIVNCSIFFQHFSVSDVFRCVNNTVQKSF